jgi:lysophospholipase L1-like esterase
VTVHAQQRAPTHVACVGDSITHGSGASSSATAYPADLQKLLGPSVQVQNFGHSGATMLSTGNLPYIQQPEYAAATTFVSNAGARAVVDVIIMLGTNDSKPINWMPDGGNSSAQFRSDYAAMVDHFTGLPTHPVVYLALPPTVYMSSYGISETVIHDAIIPIIRQIAAQKGMPVIDVHTPTAGMPSLFTADGVHPNDMGYALIAQVMYSGLRALQTDGGAAEGGAEEGGTAEGGSPDAGSPESDAAASADATASSDASAIPDAAIPVFDGGGPSDAAIQPVDGGAPPPASEGGPAAPVPADTSQSSGCTMETDGAARSATGSAGWIAAAALALLSALHRSTRRRRPSHERERDRAGGPV